MMGRTAVVAGTATAVSGRVARRQQGRWDQKAEAEAYEQQQAAPQEAPPPPAAPAAPPQDELTAKLEQLASLHNQGILTDEEFSAAKAKAIG
jgi:hypothetical protein